MLQLLSWLDTSANSYRFPVSQSASQPSRQPDVKKGNARSATTGSSCSRVTSGDCGVQRRVFVGDFAEMRVSRSPSTKLPRHVRFLENLGNLGVLMTRTELFVELRHLIPISRNLSFLDTSPLLLSGCFLGQYGRKESHSTPNKRYRRFFPLSASRQRTGTVWDALRVCGIA